jgi:hypothetical protein
MKILISLSEDALDWVGLFLLPIAERAAKIIRSAGKYLTAGGNALMWWDI